LSSGGLPIVFLMRHIPAMAELDALAGALDRYHLYHATRAELLRELGHPDQARAADRLALELTANPTETAVLQQRITWT
jgi:predicted RNA polymerase sigma factor